MIKYSKLWVQLLFPELLIYIHIPTSDTIPSNHIQTLLPYNHFLSCDRIAEEGHGYSLEKN